MTDDLPGGKVIAKDLSISTSVVPGNPYCRFNTDTEERKYCSEDLWEAAEDLFVIPEDESSPRRLIICNCCGNDSYKTDDGECGRCGKPIFDCPGCDVEVHGKPDECPHCESGYNWDDEDDDE